MIGKIYIPENHRPMSLFGLMMGILWLASVWQQSRPYKQKMPILNNTLQYSNLLFPGFLTDARKATRAVSALKPC